MSNELKDDAPCLYTDEPVPHPQGTAMSASETIAKRHEENVDASRSQRWEGQEIWQGRENEEMRMVNVMHCEEFVRKLRNAGVQIFLNNFSILGRIGLYTMEFGPNKDGVLGTWPKVQTTLQFPYSYEFSVMRFNEYNVPTNEKYRGWRTALLYLIANGVITEELAHKVFGKPMGLAGVQYLKELHSLRHARPS